MVSVSSFKFAFHLPLILNSYNVTKKNNLCLINFVCKNWNNLRFFLLKSFLCFTKICENRRIINANVFKNLWKFRKPKKVLKFCNARLCELIIVGIPNWNGNFCDSAPRKYEEPQRYWKYIVFVSYFDTFISRDSP